MKTGEDNEEKSVKVLQKLAKKGVTGKHHKQSQTIAGWFATDERGSIKQALDEMATDPNIPLREKGRGTYQITSMKDAKQYIVDHGEDLPFGMSL
jgi:hypothetical protein